MIFKALQYDSGKVKELLVKDGESIAKGDGLKFDAGLCEKAVDGSTEVRFIALEAITEAVSANYDAILALYVEGVEIEAETHADTNAEQVNLVFNLNANGKVENTKSGTYTAGDVFLVTKIVGPVADKTVRGYFLDRKQAA